MIKKQINHLMNEIERSKSVDDKMIGCSAIVLSGIAYNDNNFLSYGLVLLKKIIMKHIMSRLLYLSNWR